jgi:hypothetical protein
MDVVDKIECFRKKLTISKRESGSPVRISQNTKDSIHRPKVQDPNLRASVISQTPKPKLKLDDQTISTIMSIKNAMQSKERATNQPETIPPLSQRTYTKESDLYHKDFTKKNLHSGQPGRETPIKSENYQKVLVLKTKIPELNLKAATQLQQSQVGANSTPSTTIKISSARHEKSASNTGITPNTCTNTNSKSSHKRETSMKHLSEHRNIGTLPIHHQQHFSQNFIRSQVENQKKKEISSLRKGLSSANYNKICDNIRKETIEHFQ